MIRQALQVRRVVLPPLRLPDELAAGLWRRWPASKSKWRGEGPASHIGGPAAARAVRVSSSAPLQRRRGVLAAATAHVGDAARGPPERRAVVAGLPGRLVHESGPRRRRLIGAGAAPVHASVHAIAAAALAARRREAARLPAGRAAAPLLLLLVVTRLVLGEPVSAAEPQCIAMCCVQLRHVLGAIAARAAAGGRRRRLPPDDGAQQVAPATLEALIAEFPAVRVHLAEPLCKASIRQVWLHLPSLLPGPGFQQAVAKHRLQQTARNGALCTLIMTWLQDRTAFADQAKPQAPDDHLKQSRPEEALTYVLSCRTKLEKLLCLKYLGRMSDANSAGRDTTNEAPSAVQPTMLSDCASSTRSQLRGQQAGRVCQVTQSSDPFEDTFERPARTDQTAYCDRLGTRVESLAHISVLPR